MNRRWPIFLTTICATALFLVGCDQPSRKRIGDDFQKDYPSAEIVRIESTEGNADAVYYDIHFRMTSNAPVEKKTWLCVRQQNGWQISNKNVEGPQ